MINKIMLGIWSGSRSGSHPQAFLQLTLAAENDRAPIINLFAGCFHLLAMLPALQGMHQNQRSLGSASQT